MKKLLVFDYFRGPDSTGLASIRGDGSVHIAKIASHPFDLFDTGKFKSTLSGHSTDVFIGHNRAATKGAVNTVNAHPFHIGNIIGAHNGTLTTQSWKDLEKAVGETFDVDSQAIIAAIDKLGIEETVPLLQGAWALVWYNEDEGSLNFLRNKERSFYFSYTEDFKKLIWASEWEMIRAANDLSSLPDKLHKTKEGHGYFETKADMWYRWDIDKLKKGASSFPSTRVKELLGKEPAPAYQQGQSPFIDRSKVHKATGKEESSTLGQPPFSTTYTSKGINEVFHIFGDEDDPLAGLMEEGDFEDLAQYGCAWCSAPIVYGDAPLTILTDTQNILCSACSHDNTDKGVRVYSEKASEIFSQQVL